MTSKLQRSRSRFEVYQLRFKLKMHQSQAVQENLQAASFRIQATSHALVSNSHWLRARRYQLKLVANSDNALKLNYDLKARYHMLQAEQRRERFIDCQCMAIEHEKRASAHEMLTDYLQNKIAKRNKVLLSQGVEN